jgi:hypothetical protein
MRKKKMEGGEEREQDRGGREGIAGRRVDRQIGRQAGR